jgi:predicted RNA-binding Zn-ribbon protein involved in translation (DUF1610 family)
MKPHRTNTEMETKPMNPPLVYQVNLAEIQGEGEFPCPGCGIVISPEDETEDVYRIVDTKVNGQDLEELIIQCNSCKCKIRLVGFNVPELK